MSNNKNSAANARWRSFADWAKRKPWALRLADRLGRGHGRLRVLDRLGSIPPAPLQPDLTHWNSYGLAAVWIGHATVLLRIGGKNVLCDPVFSNRVGLGLGLATAGPRRMVQPAITLKQLPPIDLLLISHGHFDHLDRPTLARLSRKIPVLTAEGCNDLIADMGFQSVQEMKWGTRINIFDLTIEAHEVNHWGARTFYDTHRKFNAFTLRTPHHSILFAGDTAQTSTLDHIHDIDLAIIPIGAYDPYIRAHLSPEQAWELFQRLQARHLMPIHHSTFRLSHEPTHEPLQRLLAAAANERHRIISQSVGELWVK